MVPATRRRVALSSLLVVIAACAGGGGDDDASPTTSELTTTTSARPAAVARESVEVDTDASFEIGAPTGPYEVVYVVEDLTAPEASTSTETLLVAPPFGSRLDERNGPPPGETLDARQVAVLDRIGFGSPEDPLVIHRVPGMAPGDVRVRAVLDEAVEAGLLERREQRTVDDVRCQVVRSASPLGAGALRAITTGEHVDSCVDAAGVVREELLHADGEATFLRTATEVSPLTEVAGLDPGTVTAPPDQGGGSVLSVDPAHGSQGPFWVLPADAVPEGFELVGRYGVVPPQPENFSDPTRSDALVAGTADVYRRGIDALVVFQGGTRGGGEANPPDPDALDVDGGALGPGELLLGAAGSELRFAQDGGRFVHVSGSLEPGALGEVARSLVETEGTGLVYLED